MYVTQFATLYEHIVTCPCAADLGHPGLGEMHRLFPHGRLDQRSEQEAVGRHAQLGEKPPVRYRSRRRG